MPSMKDLTVAHQAALDVELANKAQSEADAANEAAAKLAVVASADAVKALGAKIAKTGRFATISDDKLSVYLWESDSGDVKVSKIPVADSIPIPPDDVVEPDVKEPVKEPVVKEPVVKEPVVKSTHGHHSGYKPSVEPDDPSKKH